MHLTSHFAHTLLHTPDVQPCFEVWSAEKTTFAAINRKHFADSAGSSNGTLNRLVAPPWDSITAFQTEIISPDDHHG